MLVCVMIIGLMSGCSMKKDELPVKFNLEKTINVKKDDGALYATHTVQNGELLLSLNYFDDTMVTEIYTKELLLLNIETEVIELVKSFDTPIRVWDFVKVKDGYIYSTITTSNLEDANGNPLYEYQVLEVLNNKEKIIESGYYVEVMKTPSFHSIEGVIYFLTESFEYVDNEPVKQDVVLHRYEDSNLSKPVVFLNAVTNYYLGERSEKLLKIELSKGLNSVGFVTHVLDDKTSKVYVVDAKGEVFVEDVEATATDLLLFDDLGVYQTIDLSESLSVLSINHYDLKTDKLVNKMTYAEGMARIVPFGDYLNGLVTGRFDPALAEYSGGALTVQLIDYDLLQNESSVYVYGLDEDRIVLAQLVSNNEVLVSVVKVDRN